MTQLLLINEKTYKKDLNEIGDIVGIFDDSHVFSGREKDIFDIVTVKETKTVLDVKIPETKQLTKAGTTEWTDEKPEEKEVWKDTDGKYKDIAVKTKYPLMYDSEKKEVKETYSRYTDNLTVQTISKTEIVVSK